MNRVAAYWRSLMNRVRPHMHEQRALLISSSIALALTNPSLATEPTSTYVSRSAG